MLAELAADLGLERRLILFGGRGNRTTVARAGWDRVTVATLPSRPPDGGEASSEALVVAAATPGLRLAVAADPSLAGHLAYRIDDRIPALVAGRDELPRDLASLRRIVGTRAAPDP